MRFNKRYLAIAACYLVSLAVLVACAKAPYTGRSQFIILSAQQELALGAKSARDVLKKEQVVKDGAKAESVRRIGQHIAAVADRPDFKWEFYTIKKDDVPNAFCLPGGKVFVYTGLFKYAKTDDELAAVMGHEVGHAIARHGAERVSTAMAAQTGAAVGIAVLAGENMSPAMQQATAVAFGVGVNVGVILPFSRAQETESDHIGLILMAKAGYDPRAALTFWESFAKQPGKKPPEFLSTHPASENRIKEIKKLLPEAMKYYEASKKQ